MRSAKRLFAESSALGKGALSASQTPAAGVPFAESLPFGSRQRKALCRVPAGKALGKAIFVECLGWLSAKYFYFFVFCAEFFLCFVSLLQTIF